MNYAGGGYGDGSSGGAEGGYDYGYLSGGGEFHQQEQEASLGSGDYYEGYSAAGPDAYQPRHYNEPYDTSSQQQHQQQQQPYGASSSSPPAASPSPDPGTSAPAAPLHFAGIALRVRRGKSESDRLPFPQTETIVQHEIANVSLASSVPLPPALCESASIVSPATAVEPTFDRSLCVETFPGMS